MKKTKLKQPGSQAAAEEPLDPADLQAISAEIAAEFTPAGEQSGVVLMDVDPHRLHAYWNIQPETLRRVQDDFAASGQKTRLVLRFRELPGQEETAHHKSMQPPLEVYDRELRDAQGHVEVEVRGAGECYAAELGLTADDGGWKSLARSNQVRMPPVGPSPEAGRETLNVVEALWPEIAGEERGKFPVAEAVEELPMAYDPSLRGGPADVLEPEFPNLAPREWVPQPQPTAAQRVEPDVSPAPDSYFEPEGIPDLAAAAKLFSSAVLSSSGLGDLEIRAELHVYGRARPGRELLLFGRPIPLSPDGSFDVRRDLDPQNLVQPLLMSGDESLSEGQ